MEWLFNMLNYLWLKIIMAIPLCFILREENIEVVCGIIFIVIIDTILGIMVGFKYNKLNSHKLARSIRKVGNYGLAMASVWVLSSVNDQLAWTFNYMGIFIILTEIFSNFEKLSLLGMHTPTKLLSKLNSDFKKLYLSEDKDQEAEKIIDKHENNRKYT
jgi:phage-related holin